MSRTQPPKVYTRGGLASGSAATPTPHVLMRTVVVSPDDVDIHRLRQTGPRVRRTFLNNLIAALVLSFAVIAITSLQVVAWGGDTLLGFRILAVIRSAMLLVLTVSTCTCVNVKVHQLYGTGESYQSFVALRALPLLLLWHLIGYFDLYIGRILPLILDFFRVATQSGIPVEVTLTRISIDVLVIIIYFIEVYLVEARGIRLNLRTNVLTVRKPVS